MTKCCAICRDVNATCQQILIYISLPNVLPIWDCWQWFQFRRDWFDCRASPWYCTAEVRFEHPIKIRQKPAEAGWQQTVFYWYQTDRQYCRRGVAICTVFGGEFDSPTTGNLPWWLSCNFGLADVIDRSNSLSRVNLHTKEWYKNKHFHRLEKCGLGD